MTTAVSSVLSALRGPALALGSTLFVMLLVVGSGGRPVLVALLGVLLAGWVLHAPLVGLVALTLTQIIWLVGNYAPGGITMLAPSKISVALTFVAWLLWAARRRVPLTYAPHMVPLGLFVLTVFVAPLWMPDFKSSITGVGKYTLMVVPYFLVANLAVTRRATAVACAAITLTSTLAAGLALVEYVLPGVGLIFDNASGGIGLGAHLDDASLDGNLAIKRVTGGLGDANWFSYTMATTLPLCLYWFRVYSNLWIRSAAIVAAIMQMTGLVLSYTRTPLIGLVAAIVFLAWKRKLPIAPLVMVAIIGAASAPLWLPAGFVDRFFSQKYLEEGSTPMRKEIYGMAVDLILEKPLLGHGYDQFGPQFISHSKTEMGLEWERRDLSGEEPAHLLRAHNIYLDLWVMHGLIGLLLMATVYLGLLRELSQVVQSPRAYDSELATCLMSALISFYLCGMGGHAQELKVFWVLAGLAAGLRRVAFSK